MSNGNVTIFFGGVPIYFAITQFYGVGTPLNSMQNIFLTLELFVAVHSVPMFVKAYTDGGSLCRGMNTLVDLEKYLRSKKHNLQIIGNVNL